MKASSKILIISVFFLLYGVASVNAVPKTTLRNKEFNCPSALRGRVDFWIAVFAKHGKHEVVMHHRAYPQAIYGVLDMRKEGDILSPISFDNYKKKMVTAETKAIAASIRRLANGSKAQSQLDLRVKAALAKVPGGSAKYKKALEAEMIRSQTGIKEKYETALKSSGRYMHILEQVFVADYGLPIELTRLPFIESSFDYSAYSSVGAAGIWQFMPRTGRAYGMQVGSVVDERRDVTKATKGAARYLSEAYQQLGSWPLALTSYNHGVAGVRKKVRQAGTRSIVELIENQNIQAFGFASGNFWPEFLAALDVYDDYQSYFPGLTLDSPRHSVSQPLTQSASAGYVSRKLGISVDTLRDYNYALSPGVWKGRYLIPRGYQLKVPSNAANRVSALRAPEQRVESSAVYGGTSYRVRTGDTLGKIAKKYGVSVAHIKAINNLNGDVVRVGQLLLIKESAAHYPTKVEASTSIPKITTSEKVVAVESSARVHIVKRGDSLWSISKKYKTTVKDLQRQNNLRSGAIKIGQRLKIE